MPTATVDSYSVRPLYIELYFNEMLLSHGTAFLWCKPAGEAYQSFLVTNWHNFTGRDFFTKKCLDVNNLSVPNKVKIFFRTGTVGNFATQIFPLFDDNDKPLWLELAAPHEACDIAALHISIPDEAQKNFLNAPLVDGETNADDMRIDIGSDVYLLGYPFKLDVQNMPVWKRGSIATEPGLVMVSQEKYFLVDTASRPGMSGSPVIARRWGPYMTENGDLNMCARVSD